MRQTEYKYKVNDIIKFKEQFSPSASCGLKELAGCTAKVVECRDYDGPSYRLEGHEGFFQECCFQGRVSYPYVIFAGDSKNHLEPRESAPTEEIAIEVAKSLQEKWNCVEATYMPEDNFDINEVVYSYYQEEK